MKVLFDPQIFRWGRNGLTRYYAGLYHALRERGFDVDLPVLISGCPYLKGRPVIDATDAVPRGRRRLLHDGGRLARYLYHRRLASRRYDALVVTEPAFDDTFLAYVGQTPWLMVVHDTMTAAWLPYCLVDMPGDNLNRLSYLARRASHVVCISRWTQSQLVAATGVPESRTGVVLSASFLRPSGRALSQPPRLPERYVLFVGARSLRKGFHTLVQALGPLFRDDKNLHLVCASGPFNVWERDFLDHEGLGDRALAWHATDDELIHLYQNALCLALPSLSEGFGFPVAEALQYGCPVVTSNTTSLPEVAGEAALYVDPTATDALREQLRRVVGDAALREQLRTAGRARAAQALDIRRWGDEMAEQLRRLARTPQSG